MLTTQNIRTGCDHNADEFSSAFYVVLIMEEMMIKVLLDINSRKLSDRLGERLCELSDRLMVSTEDGSAGTGEEFDFIIREEDLKDIFPVSALAERIALDYSIKEGKPFYGPEKGIRRAFFFSSPFGGRGASAVAFVFARLLQGKGREKVLFADTGSDGLIYGEFTEEAEGREEELMYMIRKGRSPEPGRYLSRDYYGPRCICIRKEHLAEAAAYFCENSDITALVAVSDPAEGPYEESGVIRVLNIKDARYLTLDQEDADHFTVHNRDYINRVNDRIVCISDDPLSFKTPGSGVRITMDGEFALGVEKLLKEVTDIDGYGGIQEKMSY